MVQNRLMKLDHISYVASHEQLADTVQRLGSRLNTTFVDGGIHPRFGTRNFTTPLLGGQYLEVVCPVEHPATETTPWGRAVSQKANEGGGWLTWVFSTNDITPIEKKFGRASVQGNRKLPDGSELTWKQIGVTEIFESRELPFFIEWLTNEHPSTHGIPISKIHKIQIIDPDELSDSWFKSEIIEALGEISIEWAVSKGSDDALGISYIEFESEKGIVRID